MTLLAVAGLGSAVALADPDKVDPNQPVALYVDVSETQIPQAHDLEAKQYDLNGLPVHLNKADNNDIGLKAGRTINLGGGFSLDGTTALSRRVTLGQVFSTSHGMSGMTAGITTRCERGGWDIAIFPEIGTARLDADQLPNYVLGGSVAHHAGSGWSIAASSRYELRRTDTMDGGAGTDAHGELGVTHLAMFGSALDLGYFYDWVQPEASSANLSHGPTVAIDFGLSDTLNCRIGYRYAFAGDVGGSAPGFAWLSDGGQDVSVGWDWDLAAEGFKNTTFSAGLSYHQDFFDAATPPVGSGTLNLATAF